MSGYVDEMVSNAVNGIVPVGGDYERVGEAMEAAREAAAAVMQGGARRARLPGSPPPTVPFGRSERSVFRRAPLGFPAGEVPANASLTFTTQQVSRVFHPNRLLIVPQGPGLVVDSIRIGDEEQTVTPGAPVELYGVEALTDTLADNFSPVQTGTTVTITLRNTTAGALDVTLGMKGGVER